MQRITVYLDELHQQRLAELMTLKGEPVSAVICEALDVLYEQKIANHNNHTTVHLDSDFIGCVDGSEKLPENDSSIS